MQIEREQESPQHSPESLFKFLRPVNPPEGELVTSSSPISSVLSVLLPVSFDQVEILEILVEVDGMTGRNKYECLITSTFSRRRDDANPVPSRLEYSNSTQRHETLLSQMEHGLSEKTRQLS